MSVRKLKKKKTSALRKPAVQVELPLPPPPGPPLPVEEMVLAWWQKPAAVVSLAAVAMLLLVLGAISQLHARRDRAQAAELEARVKTLTLRASTAARALRITPNPRSWSAAPDASIGWPEPPLMLDLYLPVGYSQFTSFAVTIDKVDQGRMMTIQRMAPDSNRELRLSLNSSAFGPGEYRILLQGYDWRGQRSDTGWVRFIIRQ
ncbi:MAG: hypothetical protein MUO39_03440 [Steroidobacteraceae bacterium]|nr:hypothetical protein [Steroidobacteraceae bacterium]